MTGHANDRPTPVSDTDLSDADLERYARNVILDEIGEEGQLRLLSAKVAIIGAGGLGSPVLMYLAGSGIGTIGLVDDDRVDRTNLQRQIAHTDAAVGTAKVNSALDRARALNPAITLVSHETRLTPDNATDILGQYDLVIDGTDSHSTRLLVNDVCFALGLTLVSGSVVRFEGQVASYHGMKDGPCYRCVFPEEPANGLVARCDQAGILGPVAGVIGSLMAIEVVKQILADRDTGRSAFGSALNGKLLLYDGLDQTMTTIKTRRNPSCPTCGLTSGPIREPSVSGD